MNNETILLLEKYFDVAFAAPDGVKKLRELILSLAMQGKLVPQDPSDQSARELLKEIEAEKSRLVKDGKIKASKPLPEIKPDEVPYDLPKSWEWVRLGSYCYIFSGNAFKSEDFNSIDGIKAIKITNAGVGELIQTSDFLPARFAMEYCDYQVRENDLILALTRPYISSGLKISICPLSYHGALLNQRVASIRPFQFFNFIFFFLSSPHVLSIYQKRFGDSGLQPNLKMSDITELLVPIPPLAEQRRIVAKIDELMARCDELEKLRQVHAQKQITVHTAALNQLLTAKDHNDFKTSWHFITQHFGELYSVKANVTELRKAILQLAVMGKLVPQDPNDQPASELLNAIALEKKNLINEKKIKQPKPLLEINPDELPYELPKSWQWSNIQSISLKVTDGEHITPQRTASGYYLLSARNITNEGIKLNDVDYVPHQEYERIRKRCDPEIGDILVSCSGSVGRIAIVDANDYVMVRSVALIKYEHNLLKPSFFANAMKSPIVQSQIVDKSRTTAQSNLFLGKINEILIPVPPLAEQHRIVAKIDQLMTLCDELEKQIDIANSKKTNLLNSVMTKV